MAAKKRKRNRNTRKKITASRVRLDRQGYTSSGRYFGIGAPLYEYYDEETGTSGYVRAKDSKTAKKEALERPGYWGIR